MDWSIKKDDSSDYSPLPYLFAIFSVLDNGSLLFVLDLLLSDLSHFFFTLGFFEAILIAPSSS